MKTDLSKIANDILKIKELETRYSDRLDFHEVAVWDIKKALEAAFKAGYEKCLEIEINYDDP